MADLTKKQYAFSFNTRTEYSRADFMVSECNQEALNMVEMWPNWPFFAVLIYGPQGCGKTHLAHIFGEHICKHLKTPFKLKIINAQDLKGKNLTKLHRENPCLAVENLSPKADNETLFHLFNLYQNEGGFILFTSPLAPARMNFPLADLKSRLKIIPSVAVTKPDDDMLSALIIKLFTDRQITITPEVLSYILSNTERSFSYVQHLVAEADAISLTYQCAVTVNVIKKALKVLNTNLQPELF